MLNHEHPFDRLKYDVLWETAVYFELFGSEVRLSVGADETGPENWQREAFDRFFADQPNLKDKVENAIFAYYQSIVKDYRAQFSKEFLHLAPLLKSVSELSKVISPEAVCIRDIDPESPEIGLLYECSWDDSHGLGVRLLGSEVLEVGPQDICL